MKEIPQPHVEAKFLSEKTKFIFEKTFVKISDIYIYMKNNIIKHQTIQFVSRDIS